MDDGEAKGGEEPQYERLTERSKEVLRLVAKGLTTREIGDRLGIADITVNDHIERATRRLGVNRRVDAARLLALHERGGAPPTIPAQRPAAIIPVWRHGVLDVPPIADSASDQASILAALEVLREALDELYHKLSKENAGVRECAVVRETADSIPKAFPNTGDVFRLGHRHDVLATMADIAGDEWSTGTYSSYAATLLHYQRVLKQFPAWKAFVANALEEREPVEDLPQATQAAEELLAALQEVESTDTAPLATPNLLAELEQLKAPVGFLPPSEGSTPVSWRTLRFVLSDIVESIGNIIKAIAEAAIGYLKIASVSFRREIDKQAEIDGAKAFHWLRRVAKIGLVGSGGSALGALIVAHPEHFAWVAKVIQFIMRAA
jgi:DNA-binding CsgD family transcriptional regulator